jgi:hypothetical protein
MLVTPPGTDGPHCAPSHISTCPVAGAAAETARFWIRYTVTDVSRPLRSPPIVGNCPVPTVPDICPNE